MLKLYWYHFEIARDYEDHSKFRNYEITKFRNLAPALPKFRLHSDNYENFVIARRNFVISCWSFIGIISYCDTQHEITKFRNYEITRLRDYEITRLRDYEITRLRDFEITRKFLERDYEIARARLRNFVISCWSFIGIISYCDTQHEITKFRNYEITKLRDYEITRFRNFEI